MFADFIEFLNLNGIDLRQNGSEERGLIKKDALEFIELLHQNRLCPIGIEVWEYENGHFNINSLATWIPEKSSDIDKTICELLAYINSFESDICFTVQF